MVARRIFPDRVFGSRGTMAHCLKAATGPMRSRTAWIARLEAEGRLQGLMVPPVPVPVRILYFGVGYALIGLGVFLMVFALANVMLLTLQL